MLDLIGIHSSDFRALNALRRPATPKVRVVSLRPTLRLLEPRAGLLTCYVSVVYH